MTQVNDHGQPLDTVFNKRRNEEKAAYVLRGILQGVIANHQVNKAEMLYLDEWVKKQENVEMEGDALDLVCCVKDILDDGEVTNEEMDDIKDLIDTILTYGVPSSPYEEPRINEFFGILKGICSDKKLDFLEINRIERWIDQNADLADKFPVGPVYDRIRTAKIDGVIEQCEKDDLHSLLIDLTGERSDIHGSVASFFSDTIDGFEHKNQNLCFTGKFLFGTRKQCEETAQKLGASTTSDVSRKVNVIVIGTVTSRDWMFDTYGRKIETAINLRNSHGFPKILSEEQWVSTIKLDYLAK